MDNAVDKKFREALAEHKVNPSADLWAKLDGQLDAVQKSKKPKWYLFAVAALLILMIGIPSINFFLIDGGSAVYHQRREALSLVGDEVLESPLKWQPKQVLIEKVAATGNSQTVAVLEPKEVLDPEITTIEEPITVKRRVIKAYAKPLAMLSKPSEQLVVPNENTVVTEQKKNNKWTVKRAWEQLKALKKGDVKLPRNIHLTLPKPDLFASK